MTLLDVNRMMRERAFPFCSSPNTTKNDGGGLQCLERVLAYAEGEKASGVKANACRCVCASFV